MGTIFTGIGIYAFRLLDPVPLSAGREFHKIVTRFYWEKINNVFI